MQQWYNDTREHLCVLDMPILCWPMASLTHPALATNLFPEFANFGLRYIKEKCILGS